MTSSPVHKRSNYPSFMWFACVFFPFLWFAVGRKLLFVWVIFLDLRDPSWGVWFQDYIDPTLGDNFGKHWRNWQQHPQRPLDGYIDVFIGWIFWVIRFLLPRNCDLFHTVWFSHRYWTINFLFCGWVKKFIHLALTFQCSMFWCDHFHVPWHWDSVYRAYLNFFVRTASFSGWYGCFRIGFCIFITQVLAIF